jgi:glycerophosphoryl diester phosphodiesterase
MRGILGGAIADFRASWRTLTIADLAYKLVAFAILTPAAAITFRWLLSRSGASVVSDVDIARFLITTPEGIIALLLATTITAAIVILEVGCLMGIGVAAAYGVRPHTKEALIFGAEKATAVIRLSLHMVVRVIAAVIPFVAAIGLVYIALLRDYDINYYLSRKPPVFIAALAIVGVIGLVLAVLAVWTVTRWAFALPLVLFEDIQPRKALRESKARSQGHRTRIAAVLGVCAVVAVILNLLASWLVTAVASMAAARLEGSTASLVSFLTLLLGLWGLAAIVVSIITTSFFSLLVGRLWMAASASPVRVPDALQPKGRHLSRRALWALTASAVLISAGVVLLAFAVVGRNQPILVLAHRGSSKEKPENTLAAFRRAIEEHADFVELDVQESLDGQVMVIHDSDLMKVGGSSMKIWEHTAAELRSVDIGQNERVPLLSEVFQMCKGTGTKVLVELKTYGHNQQLEQRVIDLVENAGMVNECMFMSLDKTMVETMKRLRPSWRTGILFTKAAGDPSDFNVDFLGVEARSLNARLVRRAHSKGKEVYVWTVDDPAWMFEAASRGCDGLITNKPALAREVLAQRADMGGAERLLIAVLVRAGVRPQLLEPANSLRP